MAKQTWVNVGGVWRKAKSAWVNINGVWKKDVMPAGIVNGNWEEFMQYISPYIYVASNDKTVKKMDNDGNVIWSYNQGDKVLDVVTDPLEFVYSVTYKNISKLDSEGILVWEFEDADYNFNNIAVDIDGYVYASSTDSDPLIKITPDGVFSDALGYRVNRNVRVDSNGDIYGSGSKSVYKLYPNGVELWSEYKNAAITALELDSYANVYIGRNNNTLGRANSSWEFTWDSTHTSPQVNDISINATGEIYITTDTDSTGGKLRKINSQGKEIYNTVPRGTVYSLSINSEGELFVGKRSFYSGLTGNIMEKYIDGISVWETKVHEERINAIDTPPGKVGTFAKHWG